MSNDYERTRITEQIKRLQRELGTVEFDKTRTERDERSQLEQIKSEYKTKISKLESTHTNLITEIRQKEAELKRFELRSRETSVGYVSPAELAKEKRLKGHLH